MTSRRAFLSAQLQRKNSNAIRPPGSAAGFEELCSQCDDCAAACPENVIAIGSDGFPELVAANGPCTFCGACAQACPTQALDADLIPSWQWRARVEASSCLSMNGVSCRICQDNCEQEAIRFRLQLGGRAEPTLNTELCSGCSGCVAACPAGAIALHQVSLDAMEVTQ
ncbi:ferredoxin-type protein NapF [Ruegeria sp.]|uniref:ferredoxin-type protein NapF n=1 Tax=Ruegeria sp. TaxID=1879320 RepID=UPI003C7E7B1A